MTEKHLWETETVREKENSKNEGGGKSQDLT
jgi:hypothetical protein